MPKYRVRLEIQRTDLLLHPHWQGCQKLCLHKQLCQRTLILFHDGRLPKPCSQVFNFRAYLRTNKSVPCGSVSGPWHTMTHLSMFSRYRETSPYWRGSPSRVCSVALTCAGVPSMKNKVSSVNKNDSTCGRRCFTLLLSTAVVSEKMVGDNVCPCFMPDPGWSSGATSWLPIKNPTAPSRSRMRADTHASRTVFPLREHWRPV